MKTRQGFVVAAMLAIVTGSGCVGLDEHRQLQMSHRTLEAEKAQLEQELYDARNNNEALRARLGSAEGQLGSKDQLAMNLQSENERMAQAMNSAQSLLEEMAKKNVPNDPIILEAKLPAELDSALKGFAARFPDSVYYDPARGIVKWTSDLLFALGSDAVKSGATDSLRGFASIMNSSAASGFEALVVGHTDNTRISRAETKENHPTNWHLSVHRAIAVTDALQQQGLASTRLGVMGFGEYRPVASNASATGRSQNRRVEIYIVPAGTIGGVVAPQTATASVDAPARYTGTIK